MSEPLEILTDDTTAVMTGRTLTKLPWIYGRTPERKLGYRWRVPLYDDNHDCRGFVLGSWELDAAAQFNPGTDGWAQLRFRRIEIVGIPSPFFGARKTVTGTKEPPERQLPIGLGEPNEAERE